MGKSKYLLKTTNFTIEPSDEKQLWDADWIISERDGDHERIGTVSFAGEKSMGTVPIRIELVKRCQNRGIGTEVLRMMVNWAFLHKNVYEVSAVTEHENDKCVNALQKAGFVFRYSEDKLETYTIKKQKSVWTGLYLLIGITIGLALGIIFSSSWIGLGIGLLSCILAGLTMDNKDKKDREKVTGKRDRDRGNRKKKSQK